MVTPDTFLISAAIPALMDDVGGLRRLAKLADSGDLDFLIVEQPGDALVAASWLIPLTRRLGLVSTLSAIYAQPFHVARSLSAMDILSSGRMGWSPMLGVAGAEAGCFGNLLDLPSCAAQERTAEFVAATQALWDSWDADALIIDKAAGQYLDSKKIRRVDFRGTHLQIMGPLNAARPPQGYPVLVLNDYDPSFDLLSKQADVLVVAASSPIDARQRVDGLRRDRTGRILIKIECTAASLVDMGSVLRDWHLVSGCDGFHLTTGGRLADLESVLGSVLPSLRQSGLLAPTAGPETLRDRLRLPVPVNPYSSR